MTAMLPNPADASVFFFGVTPPALLDTADLSSLGAVAPHCLGSSPSWPLSLSISITGFSISTRL